MSAAELARRAGLSKATLSQLEAGQGNPTINTLAAVAVALAIPLSDLVDQSTTREDIHLPAEPVESTRISRRPLDRIPAGSTAEAWELSMPPHQAFDGVPHVAGTVESLFVVDGSITITTAQLVYELGTRDYLSFNGEQPHSYATGDAAAVVLVLLTAA